MAAKENPVTSAQAPHSAAGDVRPLAAIVLAGGLSRRMGLPKASLPFGEKTMLAHVVERLGEVCRPIVVVLAANQRMPELPVEVIVVRDQRPERGPLEGILSGLKSLDGIAEMAFVTGCDVPRVEPAFVVRLYQLARGAPEVDIVAPQVAGRPQPLSAMYRVGAIGHIEAQLARHRLKAREILEIAPTLLVDAETLREVDPELGSLANLNRPEDYLAALRAAGHRVDPQILSRLTARLQEECDPRQK